MHPMSDPNTRDALLAHAQTSVRRSGAPMTHEALAKACERGAVAMNRHSNDPLAGVAAPRLRVAQKVLAIQGITEPTYDEFVAACELGNPSLLGVQR